MLIKRSGIGEIEKEKLEYTLRAQKIHLSWFGTPKPFALNCRNLVLAGRATSVGIASQPNHIANFVFSLQNAPVNE